MSGMRGVLSEARAWDTCRASFHALRFGVFVDLGENA
jgi:hypothetical protein